jgi:hypothetical protein
VVRGAWDDGQFFVGVPFFQMLLLMRTTLEGSDGYFYLHRYGYRIDATNVTAWMLFSTLVHTGIALLFLTMAVRAFRRRIM